MRFESCLLGTYMDFIWNLAGHSNIGIEHLPPSSSLFPTVLMMMQYEVRTHHPSLFMQVALMLQIWSVPLTSFGDTFREHRRNQYLAQTP